MRAGAARAFALALFAVLAVFPFVAEAAGNPYLVSLASRILVWALAAASLGLLVGRVGLVSLGHAAWFGIGAYVVGILAFHAVEGGTFLGIPGATEAAITFPLAILLSGLVATVVGALCLRTGGIYFIMITLAFAQMIYYVTVSLERYGGDDGLFMYAGPNTLLGLDLSDERTFYYVCLAALAAFLLFCRFLLASRLGVALGAIRQNEARMITFGYPTYRLKLAAFAIAGAGAGLAGALAANQASFVSPDLLHWTRSGELLFMVILGGAASLVGPVLGAAAYLLLEEYLPVAFDAAGWELLKEHWRIVFGPLLILVMLFNRRGIHGLLFGSRPR